MNLHIGCGQRYIPGFIHVDEDEHSHIDYQHTVKQLPFIEDCQVELLYASHVLEYFAPIEAKEVLNEWCRVIKPNGVIRLAVPDFDALLEAYQKDQDLNKILGPLYGNMKIRIDDGEKWICHKTVYNYSNLKNLLEETGFRNIRKYNWKETIHNDYDDHSQAYIPHMDKTNGLLISLNVEGTKT